jgi:hypothetical protein
LTAAASTERTVNAAAASREVAEPEVTEEL